MRGDGKLFLTAETFMAVLPFFAMPQKQVQEILAKVSQQDRKRIEKGLEHSRTLFDLCGKHIPHEFEKENLRDVISQRDTYVVDSNSDWKKECKEHLDKAFIISPTLARENPNTRDLILEATRSKLGNIFSVGIDARLNCVLIERIDEHFQYEFDIPKLSEASREKGETFAKLKIENRKSIEIEKGLIRAHIGNELFLRFHSTEPQLALPLESQERLLICQCLKKCPMWSAN